MPVEGVVLPDPLTVAHQLLKAALAPVAVFTEFPVDVAARVPCVVVSSFSGGGVADARFAARTNLQLDAYAADRQAAYGLARDGARALVRAQLRGTRTAAGVAAWVGVSAQPAPFPDPDLPEGLRRSFALFTITVRP